MFKKLKSKLIAGLAAVACGACAMGVYAQAEFVSKTMPVADAETAPVLTIESNNVSYADSVYIVYAVATENVDASANVQMLFWNEPQTEYVVGTQAYAEETKGTVTVHEKECLAFYSEGLSAKQMTDDVYCRAYVEVGGTAYYSEVKKYSVLQYVYDMRTRGDLSAEQTNMYTAMLEYGAAAQLLLVDKVTGEVHNGDRLANDTYYSVSVANATFEDGFGYGLYKAGDVLTVTANAGYEFNSETANAAFTVVDGAITLTVPTENFTDDATFTAIAEDPIEPPVEEEKTFTNTYTFADYDAGTQYALNEVHVLDEFVTVTVDNGHFTTQLRLYSSDKNNSTAIIEASNVIDAISFNAGYKVDTLNIYGSVDGVTFTADPIATVAVTTSYNDYEVDIDETAFYKYLKLDVAGTQQIRIASFSITIFNEGQEPEKTDEQKVTEAADAFDLGASEVVEGLTVAELPTDSDYEGVALTWTLEETEYATLEGTTLTVGNPVSDGTFTLVATFTCGEATATKSYDFQIEYVPTGDQEKLDTAMADFTLEMTTVNAGEELYLNTYTGVDGVTVVWSMEDTAYATLNDNVLTAAAVNESATLNVTATFTCGGVSGEKNFAITMVGYTETLQAAVANFSLGDNATIYFEEVVNLVTDYGIGMTISWAFKGEYASTLVDNVLTASNVVETLTLVATFTYNTATVTEEYTVEVIEIPTLTIPEALELGVANGENVYTEEEYLISGTITGYYENANSETRGLVYITDEEDNRILVYGLYDADGNAYSDMIEKPIIGYTITVRSTVGNYRGTAQLRNAVIMSQTAPTDAYKVNVEVGALVIEETLIGAQELPLPTAGETFTDVAIAWEVTAGGNASVVNNVLITTNPTEDTQVTLTATLTLGEAVETKILYVMVKHLAEGEVAPATASMSVFGTTGTLNGTVISWSSDYFDVINEKGASTTNIRTSDSNHYRVYKNSTLKFVGTNGATITQVSVTCTSTDYATALQTSTINTTGVTATVSGSVVTYTVESGSVAEINIKMSGGQARISAVEVTYLAA